MTGGQGSGYRLIFLDTETTGNGPNDRLCQVCWKADGVITVKNFKPPVPISVKAMSITHITNEMVAHEPPFAGSETMRELETLLSDGILVAHNAAFDIGMLKAEGMSVPRHIDTLRLARYLDTEQEIPEYNLQYLRYHFGVRVEALPHSADGDVIVLEAIFEHLYAMAAAKAAGKSREEILDGMIAVSNRPSLIRRFPFGKHSGELVTDVAKTDRGYLEWLLRSKLEDGGDDADWIYTLRITLGEQEGAAL
ncbi:MAG TPA: 3'-5' exonuclease [Candidatus Paceibacterota bacterium]|nr:3'-5' exonuclease [Candidatus Paceibacterota bacterium]